MDTLTQIEGRVLGTLIEKENIVPMNYPMTITGLLKGVNQRTNRTPIMYLTETEVLTAVDSLVSYNLATVNKTTRGFVYAHNMESLKIPSQVIPLIATLLLKGPLTAGELRFYSTRMRYFANDEQIEGLMRSLTKKFRDDPLAQLLPHKDFKHKQRWAQLLTGPISTPTTQAISNEQLVKILNDLDNRLKFIEVRLGIRSSVT